MTNLVRNDLYKALISQPIQFYDKKENSAGQLTGILSVDSRVILTIFVSSWIFILFLFPFYSEFWIEKKTKYYLVFLI